jgi:hypothetical protein
MANSLVTSLKPVPICHLPARLDHLVATSIGPPLAHRVPAMVMFPRADDGCQVGGYGFGMGEIFLRGGYRPVEAAKRDWT